MKEVREVQRDQVLEEEKEEVVAEKEASRADGGPG